jgi:hypothetical protein
MKKIIATLLVLGAILLVSVYIWVDQYSRQLAAREQALLREQQATYAAARAERLSQMRLELAQEAVAAQLGLSDPAGFELRMLEHEYADAVLTGAVEVSKSAPPGEAPATSRHTFTVHFDEDNTVRECTVEGT